MLPLPVWRSPPKTLLLASNEIHVWRVSLELLPPDMQKLHRTLSVDERKRVERFHFQKDRDRFIVAHGLLRAILSRYTDVEPDRLDFCYNPHGKPALTRETNGNALCFSLSHSRGLALYAVTCDREVGVDIECVRADCLNDRIAERFFSPREVTALRALPESARKEAFFNCWTRKEAYVKARGRGLSLPLDQFDVSLAPGEPAKLLDVVGDPPEASRWSLRDLSPGSGYVAALAAEGHTWSLECWQWPTGQ